MVGAGPDVFFFLNKFGAQQLLGGLLKLYSRKTP